MNKKVFIALKIIAALVFLLVVEGEVKAYKLKDLPKPTHTIKGVPQYSLKVVKEISSDFDEKLFFAQPQIIAVGDQKLFYVYDQKLLKVYIFDEYFKCIGQFLQKGEGPGEVKDQSGVFIGSGLDGYFYVTDAVANKLIRFTPKGNYTDDFRMNVAKNNSFYCNPVVDKEGYFYCFSAQKGIIDKYNLKTKEVVHTFLDRKENEQFVVFEPDAIAQNKKFSGLSDFFTRPEKDNTSFDITHDGKLFVYLDIPATVFIFKGIILERRMNIHVDHVLSSYSSNIRKTIEDFQKNKNTKTTSRSMVSKGAGSFYPSIFSSCFLDKDENYFFLQQNGDERHLYKFDFSGKLVEIICGIGKEKKLDIKIFAKRNGLFYGLTKDTNNPIILKKEFK